MYVGFTEIDDWFVGQIKTIDLEEQTAEILVLQKVQSEKKSNLQKRKSSVNTYLVWSENPVVLTVVISKILCDVNESFIQSADKYRLNHTKLVKLFQEYLQKNSYNIET